MTTEQDITKNSATEVPGVSNSIQIAEQLASDLWQLAETWTDFAKTTMAIPLTRAMDEIGLQLRYTLGRTPIKQHLQHLENARKTLISVDYYLQLAQKRGLVETDHAKRLRSQMINLAQQLDRYRQAVVQATNQKIAEREQQQEKKLRAASENKEDANASTSVAH